VFITYALGVVRGDEPNRPGKRNLLTAFGHASAAALSHTVNTKSNCGVPGAMNSSHDFERKPDAS
jgi:hypothetical protein